MATALKGLDRGRLRWVLALFFIALAVPAAMLVIDAYGRLRWETLHQYQTLAEELSDRIDRGVTALVDREEARGYTDYGFAVVAGKGTYLRRSALSDLPTEGAIPGLVGYFQVDAEGRLSTPLLPDANTPPSLSRLDPQELARREGLRDEIQQVLGRNRLVEASPDPVAAMRREIESRARQEIQRKPVGADKPTPMPTVESEALTDAAAPTEAQPQAQANFDLLELNSLRSAKRQKTQSLDSSLNRVTGLSVDEDYAREPTQAPKRALRKERSLLPELTQSLSKGAGAVSQAGPATAEEAPQPASLAPTMPDVRVRIFESEIDPFSLSLLDSGHFVLFRKVWRDGQRAIQGLLISRDTFLQAIVEAPFRASSLARMSTLAVAYGGDAQVSYPASGGSDYLATRQPLTGTLLHRARLSAPAAAVELIFSVRRLPAGPGATVVGWLAATLALVLCAGFYLLYRLGLRQLAVARQQQDFVAAVSHELKTPLTSIRMYGEMLREGWAPEERKPTYYEYICTESERLTRLIGNVLQLARLTRNEISVELQTTGLGEAMERIAPKLANQIEAAGFRLELDCASQAGERLRVDEDYLTQVLINLVDNALKFARDAERREIRIACRCERSELCICVRDYGPGIPAGQLRKIFRLFYRAGSELTRETVGTGIGLALVRELMLRMGGRVDATNRDPGAELRLYLPRVD